MLDNISLNLTNEFFFDDTVFIAPTAFIIGDVRLGKNCSIWFHTAIRGDLAPIIIGDDSNIQDGCIIHADPNFHVNIGKGVTLGHGAIVHGATISDNVLIGMRAVILNGAKIGENSIIGAGAVVSEGTEIPPNSIALGIPAKVVKNITEKGLGIIKMSFEHYKFYAQKYKEKFEKQNKRQFPMSCLNVK